MFTANWWMYFLAGGIVAWTYLRLTRVQSRQKTPPPEPPIITCRNCQSVLLMKNGFPSCPTCGQFEPPPSIIKNVRVGNYHWPFWKKVFENIQGIGETPLDENTILICQWSDGNGQEPHVFAVFRLSDQRLAYIHFEYDGSRDWVHDVEIQVGKDLGELTTLSGNMRHKLINIIPRTIQVETKSDLV